MPRLMTPEASCSGIRSYPNDSLKSTNSKTENGTAVMNSKT